MTDVRFYNDPNTNKTGSLPRFYSYFLVKEKEINDLLEVELLPSDNHAAAYPVRFLASSGRVLSGERNFFNAPLINNFRQKRTIENHEYLSTDKEKIHSQAILINLLDNCYGHSLLKLFNLHEFYRKYGDAYDLWVLCPSSISYWVPSDKFFLVTIFPGFAELSNCLDLSPITDKLREKYHHLEIGFLNTYMPVSLEPEAILSFYPLLKPHNHDIASSTTRYITFSCRKDTYRSWRGLNSQGKRIIKLFSVMRPFYSNDMCFCVVGEKDGFRFPDWIEDFRVSEFHADQEWKYNHIYDRSVMVIGVHGSHMILPGILADMCVHLVPAHKLHNIMEDAVNMQGNLLELSQKNVNMYGGITLWNIKPVSLAHTLMLKYASKCEKQFKINSSATSYSEQPIGQAGYIQKTFPWFHYLKALELKARIEKWKYYRLKMLKFLFRHA